MLQVISTIIFYVWMFLTLFFVWRIWQNSVTTAQAWQTLITVTVKTSEAAQKSAEAAANLAKEKL